MKLLEALFGSDDDRSPEEELEAVERRIGELEEELETGPGEELAAVRRAVGQHVAAGREVPDELLDRRDRLSARAEGVEDALDALEEERERLREEVLQRRLREGERNAAVAFRKVQFEGQAMADELAAVLRGRYRRYRHVRQEFREATGEAREAAEQLTNRETSADVVHPDLPPSLDDYLRREAPEVLVAARGLRKARESFSWESP